jgi:hypothetical protein
MLDTPCTVLSRAVALSAGDDAPRGEHAAHTKKPAIIAGQVALI